MTPVLGPGWNLMGNSLDTVIDVAAMFGSAASAVPGVTEKVETIWKWDALNRQWAYYAPGLTMTQLETFAGDHGYEILATINPGEGYWVEALGDVVLAGQTAPTFTFDRATYSSLPRGWNLVAMGSTSAPSPHEFATAVSESAPPQQAVNEDSFDSLWAWDARQQKWYFYSPLLENLPCNASPCGITAVRDFARNKGYLHFEDSGRTLDPGTGFWVSKTY